MTRRYWSLSFMVLGLLVVALITGPKPGHAADPLPYVLYHPAFQKNSFNYNATLFLNNVGSATANVQITLYGSGNTYSYTRTIVAGNLLIVPAADLTGAPDGTYAVTVTADQPIDSVVRSQRTISGDGLFEYRGAATISTTYMLGPILKGQVNSSATFFNPGDNATNINAVFRNTDGSTAFSQNYVIPAHGTLGLSTISLGTLPSGFIGSLSVTADQNVAALLSHSQTTPTTEIEAYAVGAPAFRANWPLAFKSTADGSGLRTTGVFVGNPTIYTANFVLQFYNTSGVVVHSLVYSLPSLNSQYVALADIAQLPSDRYSVVMVADQALVFGVQTYHPAGSQYGLGDYEVATGPALRLPYVTRTDTSYSVLNLQNQGSGNSTVTITYLNISGAFVYSQTVNGSMPGQVQQINLEQLADLTANYIGTAQITSDQPMAALVEEQQVPPCTPPTNVHIEQSPPGIIYTYTPITFTAIASGTLPFSYTWSIAGTPLTVTTGVITGHFIATGHFTSSVTVSNLCGAGHADWGVDVEPLPPDLSSSQKLVNLTHIAASDQLTYTLLLRNANSVAASAVLTDLLPAHLQYIPDSLSASSGVITFTGAAIEWQGTIISGTPVVLEYSAQVLGAGLLPGDRITNTAQLDDGLGHITTLTTHSIYDPGYRLSINNGALYTNLPTVTLALSWQSETPPITHMQISNDGGFASGTGWISVNAGYAAWTLTTYGSLQLPRTVYARFRDGNGLQYGPIQDDIIYDPVAPQVTQITFSDLPLRRAPARTVVAHVTSADDNSGAVAVHLSHQADFATFESFGVTGLTTDITWELQASGLVYARVVDRAGNLSPSLAAHGPGDNDVYLPVILRYPPCTWWGRMTHDRPLDQWAVTFDAHGNTLNLPLPDSYTANPRAWSPDKSQSAARAD